MRHPSSGRKLQSTTKEGWNLIRTLFKFRVTIKILKYLDLFRLFFNYKSSVASVSQRSDDQTWRVPQVLVGVFNVTVDYPNANIVIAPIVTKLC